jgi:hypothetical protein
MADKLGRGHPWGRTPVRTAPRRERQPGDRCAPQGAGQQRLTVRGADNCVNSDSCRCGPAALLPELGSCQCRQRMRGEEEARPGRWMGRDVAVRTAPRSRPAPPSVPCGRESSAFAGFDVKSVCTGIEWLVVIPDKTWAVETGRWGLPEPATVSFPSGQTPVTPTIGDSSTAVCPRARGTPRDTR